MGLPVIVQACRVRVRAPKPWPLQPLFQFVRRRRSLRARRNSALAWPGYKASADEHRLAFLSGRYRALAFPLIASTPRRARFEEPATQWWNWIRQQATQPVRSGLPLVRG